MTDLCCEHPQYFDDVVKLISDDERVLFPFLQKVTEKGKFCEKVLEIYETKIEMEPSITEAEGQYMTLMNIAIERSDLLDRCCNVYGKMLNGADYVSQVSKGHEVLLSYMEANPEVVEQMSENVLGIIKSEIKPEAKVKFLESENALKLLLCIAPHIAAEEFNNVIEEGYDIKSAKLNDQDVSKLLGALRSDIVPYEEKEKLIGAVKSISGARNAFDYVSAMQDICDKIMTNGRESGITGEKLEGIMTSVIKREGKNRSLVCPDSGFSVKSFFSFTPKEKAKRAKLEENILKFNELNAELSEMARGILKSYTGEILDLKTKDALASEVDYEKAKYDEIYKERINSVYDRLKEYKEGVYTKYYNQRDDYLEGKSSKSSEASKSDVGKNKTAKNRNKNRHDFLVKAVKGMSINR